MKEFDEDELHELVNKGSISLKLSSPPAPEATKTQRSAKESAEAFKAVLSVLFSLVKETKAIAESLDKATENKDTSAGKLVSTALDGMTKAVADTTNELAKTAAEYKHTIAKLMALMTVPKEDKALGMLTKSLLASSQTFSNVAEESNRVIGAIVAKLEMLHKEAPITGLTVSNIKRDVYGFLQTCDFEIKR